MNKTKIEYADYTWNPVTGCRHGCEYCYARRIATRFHRGFEPAFHEDRLLEPDNMKEPATIFVCSMADLFGEWVDFRWILDIMKTAYQNARHTFLFLTKNPARYSKFDLWGGFPDNCWLGTSCDSPYNARMNSEALAGVAHPNKWISVEPLLKPLGASLNLEGISSVVVGAQTGPGARKPPSRWVEEIIFFCKHSDTKVFLKDNLDWGPQFQFLPRPFRELPWEVRVC